MTDATANLLGVSGKFYATSKRKNGLYSSQKFKSEYRTYQDNGVRCRLRAEIRFDDECNNGHQSFSITAYGHEARRGMWRESIGGCCHDEIAKIFPEFKHLIKWHLHSTDGPMHGIANAAYHASNRDYNGLLKGETRQIRNGRTGKLCWKIETTYHGETIGIANNRFEGDTPPAPPVSKWVPVCHVGEGKERNLQAARDLFPTIEISDEILMLPKDQLIEHLKIIMPQSIADFKADMLALGFDWCELEKADA